MFARKTPPRLIHLSALVVGSHAPQWNELINTESSPKHLKSFRGSVRVALEMLDSLPRCGKAMRRRANANMWEHPVTNGLSFGNGCVITRDHGIAIMAMVIDRCFLQRELVIVNSLIVPTVDHLRRLLERYGQQLEVIVLKRCHERTLEFTKCGRVRATGENWLDHGESCSKNAADEVLFLIAKHCSNCLKTLVLSDADSPVPITDDAVMALSRSAIVQSLVHLDVSTLVFVNRDGGDSFSEFVHRCRSLETLRMVGTVFLQGDNHQFPLPIGRFDHRSHHLHHPRLQLLDLDQCSFNASSHYVFSAFASLLDVFPNLEYLDISGWYYPSRHDIETIVNKINKNGSKMKFLRFFPNYTFAPSFLHFLNRVLNDFHPLNDLNPNVTVFAYNENTLSNEIITHLRKFTWPGVRFDIDYFCFAFIQLLRDHKNTYPNNVKIAKSLFEACTDTLVEHGYDWRVFQDYTQILYCMINNPDVLDHLETAGVGIDRVFDALRLVLKPNFSDDLNMHHVLRIMKVYGSRTPVDVFEMVLTNLSNHSSGENECFLTAMDVGSSSPRHTIALFKIAGEGFEGFFKMFPVIRIDQSAIEKIEELLVLYKRLQK